MKQSVIKGKDIFSEINSNLLIAKKEILVASAWFTDQELLDTLIIKAKEGLKIKVVIAENKDNEKLDFTKLSNEGASVLWVRKKGYGMLHEKYCVIDNKIAFHGLYNWTNNARRNNTESVIFTNHKETVNQLIYDFNNMEEDLKSVEHSKKAKDSFFKKIFKKINPNTIHHKEEQKIVDNLKHESRDEIDEVFNSIIAAEIIQTNEESVKERGRKLALEVGGDYKTLPNAMNSLFHLYISDNNSTSEKKERLIKKINDKSEDFILKENAEIDQKINSEEISTITRKNDLELQKTKLESKKDILELENKIISEEKILGLEEQIHQLNKKKSELKLNFVKPAFKWHDFIPSSLFFIGLSFLMVLFYSSSAYIMLYSYEDAILAISNGINVNPQVFDEGALRKAFGKSTFAGLYVLFFVFIPFAIAYIAHKNNNLTSNWKSKIKSSFPYIIIFAIDAFIAIKVSQTINRIDFLNGVSANQLIGIQDYLTDINFWLVFFLGAIPFIFVAILMNHIINIFIERTPEIEKLRLKYEYEQMSAEIQKLSTNVGVENSLYHENSVKILNLNNQINEIDQKLIYLPEETDKVISALKEETENKKAIINNKASLFKNSIENDTVKISTTALKNRISAFLEGWDEWLHGQFAYQIATTTSQNSRDIVNDWIKENVNNFK